MEEVLRIEGAVLDADGAEALRDYALEVYAGDVVYVQGDPGSGVRTLVRLLAGECALQSGRLYLDGEETTAPGRMACWRHGLYAVAAEKDLVEGMTVAENLEAIRYLPNCLRTYRFEESRARVAAFLRDQGIAVPADAPVWSLCSSDRLRLSLLKARLHGARLIVLDATRDHYEGREAQELCETIRRENRQGISFVIVSECCSAFASIATRIQLVDRGRDMKEWPGLTPHVEELLRGSELHRNEGALAKGVRPFLGIYDYAWERQENFWAYLRRLRDENPEIWREQLHMEIPEDGCCRSGGAVVIPEGSEDMLLGNLNLADNIILLCASRVAANGLRLIRRHVLRSMEARFRRRFGLAAGVRSVGELDRVNRKILSIYRFALLHPDTMVLESPYAGMVSDEVERLRRYLRELAEGGMRIVCFSKSSDMLSADCASVIVACNGRNAKMSTE